MARFLAFACTLGLVGSCSLSSLDDLKGGAPDASAPDGSIGSDAGGDAQTLACGAGTKQCGSECVTDDSPEYGCAGSACLACSLAHASATCASDGSCAIDSCEAGWGDCDENLPGCETSLTTPEHCGGCGTACGANEVCASGQCATSCPDGTTNCSGSCADVSTDAQNCGTCGNVCSAPTGGVGTCMQGSCDFACNAGYAKCGSECRDTQNDPQNCGGCGLVCSAPNAVPSCNGGACTILCAAGWGNCNNFSGDGCETSLNAIQNCGACGVVCPPGPNATPVCKPAGCSFTCNTGFGDCTPAAGCETNLGFSPLHCGACNNECPCNCQNGICDTGRACR